MRGFDPPAPGDIRSGYRGKAKEAATVPQLNVYVFRK